MNNILEFLKEEEKKQQIYLEENEGVIDLKYYGEIRIVKGYEKRQYAVTEDLYLIEKEVDGKSVKEFHVPSGKVADVAEDGTIKITHEYELYINKTQFLLQLGRIMPLSLRELEKQQEEELYEEQNQEKLEKNEEKIDTKEEQENLDENEHSSNSQDAVIDINKKVTETKTFKDLVPEVGQKNIQKVIVRRTRGNEFKFIGINDKGEEIDFNSLIQTEGLEPKKEIVKIDGVGSVVKKENVMTMLKIHTGENQGNENEGFTIKLGEYGTPEVSYYRRAEEINEYTSIPVNLEDTNQKATDLRVRQYMEKGRNVSVEDNIEQADERMNDKDQKTNLKNIDDDPYNNIEDEYEIAIKKAADRCKVTVKSFKEEMEKVQNGTIEEKINQAEENINEQYIGNSSMTR